MEYPLAEPHNSYSKTHPSFHKKIKYVGAARANILNLEATFLLLLHLGQLLLLFA